MIVLEGIFYRADTTGAVTEVTNTTSVPFAVITDFPDEPPFVLSAVSSFADLTQDVSQQLAQAESDH